MRDLPIQNTPICYGESNQISTSHGTEQASIPAARDTGRRRSCSKSLLTSTEFSSFGSSNTMGHGVDDWAVYPPLLEEWLNERAGSRLRVEVVNLAVAGESPSRRLERIRVEARGISPTGSSAMPHRWTMRSRKITWRLSLAAALPSVFRSDISGKHCTAPALRPQTALTPCGGSCVGSMRLCSMEPTRA